MDTERAWVHLLYASNRFASSIKAQGRKPEESLGKLASTLSTPEKNLKTPLFSQIHAYIQYGFRFLPLFPQMRDLKRKTSGKQARSEHHSSFLETALTFSLISGDRCFFLKLRRALLAPPHYTLGKKWQRARYFSNDRAFRRKSGRRGG
ncbi:hypothetical protein [Adlercreutzia sp. ZJ138]|uniref:hypothetical protein n=1 Tax=Adlercreutzia sp. ZJ138 TaxID=2709405 RepID=UPI0013EA9C98|nr:hypothetical protein [Adlercreutzia sp. ZJ138]